MNRFLVALLFCAACHGPAPARSDLHMQVVKLEYARAEEVVEKVRAAVGEPAAGGPALRAIAQPRQNVIVLSGTPTQIRTALDLLAQLDVEGR